MKQREAEEILRAAGGEFSAPPPKTPHEKRPLHRELPPPEQYPIEALGPLANAAQAVATLTQAPPAMAAQSVLAAATLAEAGYDETDILNFRRLVKVQHFQTLNGYPTLRSAWADMSESAKGATAAKQTQQVTGAELDDPTGREARKAQMRRAMSAPTTMPTQRGGSEAVAIKPEQALEWLRTHKNQAEWSDHDRKTFAKIRVVLGMA
jgi:hypothetical protein